ncbi:RlpA-like double-psi beta-barrel-protein domain-containing protein-containing protein [Amylocystis lapponica]|nr:RlpA-like double-psi beta-barrel-protein domain-containing protein-containing protein [Amylocystis lapponica]
MGFTTAFILLVSAVALGRAQTNTGEATYYYPGLGACGNTNTGHQYVVAVSFDFFDDFPYVLPLTALSPICQHSLTASYNGNSITAAIVDKCEACSYYDIDLSPVAFQALADLSVGRLYGVTWSVN